MKAQVFLIISIATSIAGLCYFASGVPFLWHALSNRWKPRLDLDPLSIVGGALLILLPIATILFLRFYPREGNGKTGRWARRLAVLSVSFLLVSAGALFVLHFLPARQGIME